MLECPSDELEPVWGERLRPQPCVAPSDSSLPGPLPERRPAREGRALRQIVLLEQLRASRAVC